MPGAAVMSKLEFVEHHDDVWRLAGRTAGLARKGFQAVRGRGVGFEEAVAHQLGHCHHAGAGEVGNVVDAGERLPGLFRHHAGEPRHAGKRDGRAEARRASPQPERIEPPEQDEQRNRDDRGRRQRRAQIGKYGQQKRDRIGVDDEHVEEAQGHFHNVVLEAGEHDHAHDHHQRQRRRHGRAAKQDEPEKIEEGPGQQRQRRRKRTVFGQADGEQRRRVDGRDGRDPERGGCRDDGHARKAAKRTEIGDRHDPYERAGPIVQRGCIVPARTNVKPYLAAAPVPRAAMPRPRRRAE